MESEKQGNNSKPPLEAEDDEEVFVNNCLIFVNLPKAFDPEEFLKECQTYGEIADSKYIDAYESMIVVFFSTHNAIECKLSLQDRFDVGFAEDDIEALLAPPPNKKAFWTSPPASPPDNWRPRKEDAPVPQPELPEGETVVVPPSKSNPAVVIQKQSSFSQLPLPSSSSSSSSSSSTSSQIELPVPDN
eukprot:TRINITY_DN2003_c1_g1_i1.p1 TRINITY_DN2003_c1_g1~~TRINITY_DN2003_c1_g1_i1.p1  ORF type:complete len:188 (-),score=86.94 TRINITY_DN2003_c1_g1_i1:87-650(-)